MNNKSLVELLILKGLWMTYLSTVGFIGVIIADAFLPLHPGEKELIVSILNPLVGTLHILPGKFNLEHIEIKPRNQSDIRVSLFSDLRCKS